MGAKNIYEDLKKERKLEITSEIDHKLKIKTRTLKRNESLKTAVLTSLVDAKYDECESLLENFPEKFSHFVDFQQRVSPYLAHCINLTKSIEIKRNFPKVTAMPIIKQQELMDKVIDDFNELRLYLVRIEAMHTEVIYKDVLSMSILLRAIMVSSIILAVAAACVGIGSGGLFFINNLLDELLSTLVGWMF